MNMSKSKKATDNELITGVLFVKLPKAFTTLGNSRLITKVCTQIDTNFTDYSIACHQVEFQIFNSETSKKFPYTHMFHLHVECFI